MKTLNVDLGDRSYPIYIGRALIDRPDLLARHVNSQQVLLLTNTTVAPLYLAQVHAALGDRRIEHLILPDGEAHKTLDSAAEIWDRLMERRFSRNATLVALGGGVIGDLGGFAAACYQRGIPFVQIPTTLLAQVDSSVGGKTGVNHPRGKNMIGAFYQPLAVIADTGTLRSLPDRELSAGLAEVIKYGLIRDPVFFEWIEAGIEALVQREPEALAYAIEQSCRNKAAVVAADERETGVRATLNLGHTFGHAIETGCGYGTYLHGEAVAIGTCMAARLSARVGRLSSGQVGRIESLLRSAGLPTQLEPGQLSAHRMLELMAVDKKNVDGKLRLILLEGIGAATLPLEIDSVTVKATLTEILSR